MPSISCEFILIVEAEADYRTTTGIAERALQENASYLWLAELLQDQPEAVFSWAGLEDDIGFSCWSDFEAIANRFKEEGYRFPRFNGQFSDGPTNLDYPIARNIVYLINQYLKINKNRNVSAIVLIRDEDNQSKRFTTLCRLRDDLSRRGFQIPIIIGVANPEREAWVLNGYEAQTAAEKQVLQDIKRRIGLDPCLEAHRLRGKSSQPGTEDRDIKHILRELTQDDPLREKQCWQETPLDILVERGQKTGLSQYIEEIEHHLLPTLTAGS
jgi:hypothetical protein